MGLCSWSNIGLMDLSSATPTNTASHNGNRDSLEGLGSDTYGEP